MRKVFFTFLLLMFVGVLQAQQIVVPAINLPRPRFIAGNTLVGIQQKIEKEKWAADAFNQAKQSLDEYVNRHQNDSTWIVSRLQMFWKTKSGEIFIKGGTYDHASGSAPVPTVKFPGMRGGISAHAAPKLEDLMPFMDDARGLYLQNKTTKQMEWVDIAKTGNIIEGINNNIMRMANTSAGLYYLTAEEKYAHFAFDLFDTYMSGMQYRKVPTDLAHGHHQTLAGLSSFEVIQEVAILNSLTSIYDFLYGYIQQKAPQKNGVYQDVFRKWADLQIANGVAFNNWNLMQAKNVLNIALMLEDDNHYSDGKGNQYYTNFILNKDAQRQWSLKKVVNEGFDPKTGLWNESAGYSLGVLNDVVGFVAFFDNYYQLDLVEHLPILKKAVTAAVQYLFPNGLYTSFGDSHYGHINLNAAYLMVANARKNKKPEQEKYFSAFIKTVQEFYKERGVNVERSEHGRGNNLGALFNAGEQIHLDESMTATNMDDYLTPVFSSDHVSLFSIRNGIDPKNGLMITMSGSKGNHMHAGGMAMEIYGKGTVLGPASGIGTNYFQADYAEYYSQFPAHNTVAVDGISAYPVMKSNHGFEVKSAYPAPGVTKNYFSLVSFGNLYFLEPETQSVQTRLISAIRTSDSTGYYVDIFRSKRKDGKDKMHDYFYHNMGQQLLLQNMDGKPLSLKPTDQLSFGGGHLFAYDYIYDKQSITTAEDIQAVFNLSIPGKEDVQMNMWMKGEKGREIIATKSPKSTAIDRMGLPKDISELPLPTIVARQSGEAWTKPFTVVFEPSTSSQPKSLNNISAFKATNASTDFVGITVQSKSGSTEYIFSDTEGKVNLQLNDKSFQGTYAIIREKNSKLQYLFMGNGSKISKGVYSIRLKKGAGSAALENKNGDWYFNADSDAMVSIPTIELRGKNSLKFGNKVVAGKKQLIQNISVMVFELPAMVHTKIL